AGREQLAGAAGEARRGGVATPRRVAQGGAPAAATGHRSLPHGAAQGPGLAVHLDQRAARVRHRLARLVSRRADSIGESSPSAVVTLPSASRSPDPSAWSAVPSPPSGATGPRVGP